jgi:hypothetical protein
VATNQLKHTCSAGLRSNLFACLRKARWLLKQLLLAPVTSLSYSAKPKHPPAIVPVAEEKVARSSDKSISREHKCRRSQTLTTQNEFLIRFWWGRTERGRHGFSYLSPSNRSTFFIEP